MNIKSIAALLFSVLLFGCGTPEVIVDRNTRDRAVNISELLRDELQRSLDLSTMHLNKECHAATTTAPAPLDTIFTSTLNQLGNLRYDRVIQAAVRSSVVASVISGEIIASDSDQLVRFANHGSLTYNDFEAFTKIITAFGEELNQASEHGVEKSIFPDSASLIGNAEKSFQRFVIVYLREYFRGTYVNRFGKSAEKPSLKTGIGNDVIAGFAGVLLEAAIDWISRTQLYANAEMPSEPGGQLPSKFYPHGNSTQPTATTVRHADDSYAIPVEIAIEDPNQDQGCNVTVAEAKATEFLANYFADRTIVWSGSILDAFNAVDIGFVVSGSFAVGDNKTVMTVAKTAIETIARRSAEHGFFELFERICASAIADFLDFFHE